MPHDMVMIFYSLSFTLLILWHRLKTFHCSTNISNFEVRIDTIGLCLWLFLDTFWTKVTFQSLPYENHCECYKNLAWRLWPVIFIFTYFFLIHKFSPVLRQNEMLLWLLFSSASKTTDHFSSIHITSILVWWLVSMLITNAAYLLWYTSC